MVHVEKLFKTLKFKKEKLQHKCDILPQTNS